MALCDVDAGERANKIFALYPQAVKYRNYREMLDKQKDIDAIIIATPDHTHAVIGMAAIKAGKHVYMQKPLAHSVYEARVLHRGGAAAQGGDADGQPGPFQDGTRQICEWIWSGAIGKVNEVHAWTNRPVWPQGIEVERPKETPPVPDSFRLGHVDRSRAHAHRIIRLMRPTPGGPGGISAPARSAIWAAMFWTRFSGRSSWGNP